MSLHQPSVAEAGHSNSGSAAVGGVIDAGAMEKLDLTLEEIISTGAGDRREGQSNSRTGASRHGRRPISRYEPRSAAVRRPGRAETLVNLKFAGSINKRRHASSPFSTAHLGGAITQHRHIAQPRSMLAAKALQQIPAVAAATQIPAQQQYVVHPQVVTSYSAWGTSQMPHVFVPALATNGAHFGLRSPGTVGGHKYGQGHGGRLGAQDAALLATEIIQQDNGDVIIRFKQTDLVLVKAGSGDLILNSGGYRTFSTKAILNQALQPVGLWVDDNTTSVENENGPASDDHQGVPSSQSQKQTPEWVVSDRRSYLATFIDGMVVRQAGALSKAQMMARGSVIAQYLRQRKFDAEKSSRLLNGKSLGAKRRPITRNGAMAEEQNTASLVASTIKLESGSVYQHQALESVNEDLDQMAE
eukprot:Gregarina_sp_Poly_1__6220@NODE_329_length_9477_cov_82_111477_g279_i0_p3_GENE_NODE_329_length_9477_cov_82_111477_g279_i0NODE_329_length_9477_cov_82_111477_g279_i0_p3_ORF_typecomplete_len415_score48_75_NODE_329_length_9477_cov_82_111477_g279_i04431687